MADAGRATNPGRLIVISGPSGSGKSTIVRRLLDEHPELPLKVSISATTRAPREGEEHGVHYYFRSPEEFEAGRHDLLEHARVHDHHYGTPAEPIRRALAEGFSVILVIDVQGAFQVREKVPDALLIFIQVPGLDVLEDRLRARGTEAEPAIQRRLANARRELALADRYDYQVLNDDLDRAVDELVTILNRNHPEPQTGTHS
ncbi:MAG: guanylate kinase [Planctomycetes bacterium SCN 63-9]|nr:MAG: guanylate kinase [Planctomycetes bacterium SCN 63-9]